jgi:hypothetical protein
MNSISRFSYGPRRSSIKQRLLSINRLRDSGGSQSHLSLCLNQLTRSLLSWILQS